MFLLIFSRDGLTDSDRFILVVRLTSCKKPFLDFVDLLADGAALLHVLITLIFLVKVKLVLSC